MGSGPRRFQNTAHRESQITAEAKFPALITVGEDGQLPDKCVTLKVYVKVSTPVRLCSTCRDQPQNSDQKATEN
jgi:hypothetical protein